MLFDEREVAYSVLVLVLSHAFVLVFLLIPSYFHSEGIKSGIIIKNSNYSRHLLPSLGISFILLFFF